MKPLQQSCFIENVPYHVLLSGYITFIGIWHLSYCTAQSQATIKSENTIPSYPLCTEEEESSEVINLAVNVQLQFVSE